MAEILVSDQCEHRPPLLIGGRFYFEVLVKWPVDAPLSLVVVWPGRRNQA